MPNSTINACDEKLTAYSHISDLELQRYYYEEPVQGADGNYQVVFYQDGVEVSS